MSMVGKWVSTSMWSRALVVEEKGDNCRINIAAAIPGCAPRCQWEATAHLQVIELAHPDC